MANVVYRVPAAPSNPCTDGDDRREVVAWFEEQPDVWNHIEHQVQPLHSSFQSKQHGQSFALCLPVQVLMSSDRLSCNGELISAVLSTVRGKGMTEKPPYMSQVCFPNRDCKCETYHCLLCLRALNTRHANTVNTAVISTKHRPPTDTFQT